ncbi:MAG: polysaccharide biosynthesis protein [Clostridia bacterium]|nr:polysaccharide biosynthesis protein [Clostridia bacterium]
MKKTIKNKNVFFVLSDIIAIILAYFISIHFKYILEDAVQKYFTIDTWVNIALAIVLYMAFFISGKIYKNIIRYVSPKLYIYIAMLTVCVGGVLTVISYVFSDYLLNWKCNLLATVFICAFVSGARAFAKLLYVEHSRKWKNNNLKNVLVIGAGQAGEWIVHSINESSSANYKICGMLDDDPRKKDMLVRGIPVLGSIDKVNEICKQRKIQEIIIAIPSLVGEGKKRIIELCAQVGIKVRTLPSINDIVSFKDLAENAANHVRDVSIEDLLARKPIVLNNEQLHEEIKDKTVLVTGGGGSIGSELCRQIAKHSPKTLIVLDIYENNAYDLQMELVHMYPEMDLRVVIASVRDRLKIRQVFEEYHPQIIFHAAAHKHVPLMEYNPGESIKNNVFGTYNVARAADEYGAEKFVLISTDKAVNPTNIMGATKRICEMIVQSMQEISKTEFVAVRFGNVLGSNGSVIPLFKKQIENREPLTVTHKDIIRYFMTIPEAAQLVLQAACYAKGGEIFVLDMGEPVKIYDLALNLIKLSGLKPFEDIDIIITGLRPGEKLYEELLMDEEGLKNTENSKIFIGHPIFTNMETLKKSLDKLEKAMIIQDKEQIKDIVAEVVPTYVRNPNNKKQEEVEEQNIC